MASLYKKPRSPFHWLRYRDLDTGDWKGRSLKLRLDSDTETRRAQRIADETTRKEAQISNYVTGTFPTWVPDYIETHYRNARTKARSKHAWARIWQFLRTLRIHHPRQLQYSHAAAYLEARKKEEISHNTARLELKFLSFIMQEAIRRDYADRNPLVSARIRREQPKAKPYLSPADISRIREHLKKKPVWMQTVLEICAHLGCRFNESSFSKNQVDFDKDLIWMTDSKRDETDPRKQYAVPLPESLKAYLQKLFEKQDFTVKPLSGEQNRLFNKELKATFPGATSHSLRVSFITRCHQAGISEHQAMRLVNHSNSLVHQIYSKLNIEDVRAAAKLVAPPLPAE